MEKDGDDGMYQIHTNHIAAAPLSEIDGKRMGKEITFKTEQDASSQTAKTTVSSHLWLTPCFIIQFNPVPMPPLES